ncbi:LA_2272 family surface repeat-containing protein [Bacteroides pyogenes]|uniref:LA_2272 family surface repeat-containing protein n=1 Tax=Bacteroides pyogenes TaxID=310300 RepID=UPI003FA05891
MKVSKTICTAAILMAAACLSAQNKRAGINLSLWKDISTQPVDSTQTSYLNLGVLTNMNRLKGMGINILGSVVQTDVRGVQLSGIANIIANDMKGIQFSGITNINGRKMTGVSASGLVNITGQDVTGVVLSGLINIGGDRVAGLAISGGINVSGERTSGIQLSGLANITGENMNGLMASGFLNVNGKSVNGAQIGGIGNIAGNAMNGVQIGLCNYATKVHGLQIGILNYYKEEMKGFQIGLVNANPDTKIQMMLYGGNTTIANIGVRFKNQLFYTIIGLGTQRRHLNDKFSATASYRAGLALPLYKKLSVSSDLGYEHIEAFDNKDELIPRRLYALQARVNLEYQLTEKFGLFGTGGYGLTRYYNRSGNYDKRPIIEGGIIFSL